MGIQRQLAQGLFGQGVPGADGPAAVSHRGHRGIGHRENKDAVVLGQSSEILRGETEQRGGIHRDLLGRRRNETQQQQRRQRHRQNGGMCYLVQNSFLL